MHDDIKERLNRLKGKYTQKYGHLMDEWTSMLLEEIHENFAVLTSQVSQTTEAIKEAQFRIRKSQRVLQFSSAKQTWWYGLGEMAPLAVATGIIAALIFWYAYTEKRFKEIKSTVDAYENITDYTVLAQNGKIIEKDKVQYLVLKLPHDGEAIAGLHCIFDPKKQQVLVPLNQKPTHKTDK